MRYIELTPTGLRIPVIGQGTYRMGRDRRARTREVEALRLGVSLGMTLIDTAELYSGGAAEAIVGDAVADCRDQVFLVDKLWPSNAGYRDALTAVRGMLRRLRTDRLDALLLHWPTRSVPLAETLRAFAELQRDGTIGLAGVSNFDATWLADAGAAAPEGMRLAFNQVRYSIGNRAAEHAVLPHMRENGQVAMAYSPLDRGRIAGGRGARVLAQVAATHGVSSPQAALAFIAARPGMVAIPKAVRPEHVRANAAAGDVTLTDEDLALLDAAYPGNPRAALPTLPARTGFFRLVLGLTRLGVRI